MAFVLAGFALGSNMIAGRERYFPLTFETALSGLGTKYSVLTDLLRPLLLCGNALCRRRTTRGHIDHFVGVDRGGG